MKIGKNFEIDFYELVIIALTIIICIGIIFN